MRAHAQLFLILAAFTCGRAMLMPGRMATAQDLVARLFPCGEGYTERLTIGRRAQLGGEGDAPMVYRPGAIGGSVDTSLTYGEFDLGFFADLVDVAIGDRTRLCFVDIGSGCGRLTLAASVLWPEKLSRAAGVEVVLPLHRLALEARERAVLPPSSPAVDFVCCDLAEALAADGTLSDADVLFCYSTTMPSSGDLLTELSAACGTHLREGARVVTTDRKLASVEGLWEYRMLASFEGPNAEAGGTSVGYVQEVVRSVRGGE